jgi:hypothetical protein
VEYCSVQEGDTLRVKHVQHFAASNTPVAHNKDIVLLQAPINPINSALRAAMHAIYTNTAPFICPDCLGNYNSSLARRTKGYTTASSLARHYRLGHIKNIKDNNEIVCWLCQLHFKNKSQKQSHAYTIHHITT